MTMTPDKLKAMFMDLGKPTKRGVRKCPVCGTINGTRGLTCKNRECEFQFKEGSKKSGHSSIAVRVVTGSSVQVFSVRLRDRGPDYRGFVQLPLIQDLDGNPAENVDPEIMMSVLSSAAKCYVESCPRSQQNNESVPVCLHIKSSINCSEEAQPLTLKNSVLNALDVDADIKEAIWLLATETSGPLVQRATKNIFIVKTSPSTRHPLGFLHFAFFSSNKGKDGIKIIDNKFMCSCKQFKSFPRPVNTSDESKKMCIHFYACICAFASDDALVEEFAYFINMATFTEILPDNTIVFGTESTPDIVVKQCVEDNVESAITQFKTLDSEGDSFSTKPVEMCAEELEAIEGVDTAVELEDHFDDVEEDVVTDMEEVHPEDQEKTDEDTIVENEVMISGSNTNPFVTIMSSDASSQPQAKLVRELNHTIVTVSSVYPAQETVGLHTIDSVASMEKRSLSNPGIDDELSQVQVDNNIEVIIDDHNQIVSLGEPSAKRTKLEEIVFVSEPSDTLAQASSALLTLQEATTSTNIVQTVVTDSLATTVPATTTTDYRIVSKKHTPVKTAASKSIMSRKPVHDESSLYITFHQWLGSVTERINQTMHYQFDGSPEPLVFHAPQVFFDCLQARISAGSKKKRLPNSTTGFIRRDALPLGTFTKYTWHIINILHVKQIFDTPDMHLDVTRSFIENKDGTFDLYDKNKAEAIAQANKDGKNHYLPIRPFELKTYLKVGHTSPNQKDATPFIIEWIPDILPKSRIGELRIKFEYGHQRNGQIENRTQSQAH